MVEGACLFKAAISRKCGGKKQEGVHKSRGQQEREERSESGEICREKEDDRMIVCTKGE